MTKGLLHDTIAAIATPLGQSGIGIVRVSGPLCETLARKAFRPRRASHPLPSHRLCYGEVVDPSNGAFVDEALVALMRAPRTYTREDCLEIQAHGGMRILQDILRVILSGGARMAEPGEFTLRAFLNGRIDLVEAEAVVDIIQARSHASLAAAQRQLTGEHSRSLRTITEELLDALSHLEATIDFPEEEIPDANIGSLIEIVSRAATSIHEWIQLFERGRLTREGASVMIIGAPNVGKSCLFNAILGFERAIVTDIPGTTRDLVDSWMEWRGLPVRAIDTAGLREARDPIEEEGHRLLLARLQEVDLVIWVMDASQPLGSFKEGVEAWIQGTPCVVALNKSDLPPRISEREIPSFLKSWPVVRTSAKERTGIQELLDSAHGLLMGTPVSEGLLFTHVRHKLLLEQCLQHLLATADSLKRSSSYPELAASDLRSAVGLLQEILGERASDDVLDRIFSRFCIGK